MPSSLRRPQPRSIDESTLHAARAHDVEAIGLVVEAIGTALDRVLDDRLQRCSPTERHHYECTALAYLTDGRLAVLGEWSSSMPVSFEQYVVDVTCAWLDGMVELAQRSPALRPEDWTPSMVTAALDGRRALVRELAELLVVHLRHVARLTLRWAGSAPDASNVVVSAEDMAQDYAAVLLGRGGTTLRRWDPGLGRRTLPSYLSLIAQRYFWQRIKQERKRLDREVLVLEPAASVGGDELQQALRREQRMRTLCSRLEAEERRLLDLLLQGVSAEQGGLELGINPNAFYQRKRRLMARIKAIVAALDDQEKNDGET
ncbi:hypothetical protein [Paraliomyxa miuraensis]|uniref:hypothetical protein n=1 Tax=Paraliomyxa miuraensis TaxID=376150 RepID=UPI002250D367|nr:hypothetical protein [Paraliomyxa miuraensis]MCX4240595.1 hypothetical protein [Paraliomyxa miuraensis]